LSFRAGTLNLLEERFEDCVSGQPYDRHIVGEPGRVESPHGAEFTPREEAVLKTALRTLAVRQAEASRRDDQDASDRWSSAAAAIEALLADG
jgi:hypothetical protein